MGVSTNWVTGYQKPHFPGSRAAGANPWVFRAAGDRRLDRETPGTICLAGRRWAVDMDQW